MELKLKPISQAGIPEAISKAEVYRYLNEPGEAESICRDILAFEPDNQTALRLLGLAITDQFTGDISDRYSEADVVFRSLSSEYERVYHLGILQERKAKSQLRAGRPPHTVYPIFEEAMRLFEAAERSGPQTRTTQSCAGIAAFDYWRAGWVPNGVRTWKSLTPARDPPFRPCSG